MLTYPWKCTVLHCNHLGNTWKPLVLMTRHFDYCPSASEGDNQSVRSSAPVVSRCFPGGYNVKLYISRGRLAWWLLAFLHSVPELSLHHCVTSRRINGTQLNFVLESQVEECSKESFIHKDYRSHFICVCLQIDCFMKISLHSSCPDEWTHPGDKVSMLNHIYPHKARRKMEVIICKITRLTAHFMCGLMSDLMICTCL